MMSLLRELEMKFDELEYELTRNGKELSIGAENVLTQMREMVDDIDYDYKETIFELSQKQSDMDALVYRLKYGTADEQEELKNLIDALKGYKCI